MVFIRLSKVIVRALCYKESSVFKIIIIVMVFGFFTTSCVTVAPIVNPHSEISIYGVESLPPQNGDWIVMAASGYQMSLVSHATNKNESLVANVSIHQLPEFSSNEEFLEYIINYRASEPNIGRFEIQKNTADISSHNGAICIKYHSISKDMKAKIQGGNTDVMLLENIGYNCIHPEKSTVGVNMEYSLRHFAETNYSSFEKNGNAFFYNVNFTPF